MPLRIPGTCLHCFQRLERILSSIRLGGLDLHFGCLGLPVLLQQHQDEHEWAVPRMPETLRREEHPVEDNKP